MGRKRSSDYTAGMVDAFAIIQAEIEGYRETARQDGEVALNALALRVRKLANEAKRKTMS